MSSVTDILLVHSKELRELKNLDSDTELSWLRKENARLKDENEKITERVNNLSFVLADLQDKAARANEEKASLMTSIRLFFKDLESTQPINVNHLETPHDQQQSVLECSSDTKDTNSEHVVTIPTKNSFSPLLVEETNTNDNETDADNENNKRQQRDSATQTVKKDHNSHKKPKDKPAYEQRAGSETGHRLNVAIIGDSMVKHLNPSKLRKGTKHNINVQTFSGANVADMRYYVKPAISRSPDYLLLHVGTNDLKRQTPQQIAGSISTLCQEIVKESPNTKIVLSKVITRSDDSSLDSKIKELNCKLSQQHIQCPTRITSTTASLLDVILTYYGDDKILDTGVIHLGISDHSLVYLCRKLSIPKAPPKTVFTRHYKNNVNQFNNDLSEVFSLPLDSAILTDPNALWNDFKNKFLSVADKHAPIRQRRVKSEYKPWLTNEIKQMSYRRDYLKKQSIKLRSAYYDKAYKRCKNKLNNLIKETKQEYFGDKLSNAKNSKESWRTINELLNKKPKTSEVKELDINGQLITDDDKIADAFNQYFSTIGSTLSDKITGNCTDPMNFVTPLDGSIFNFTSVTLQETIDAFNEIKTKKSPGLDAKFILEVEWHSCGTAVWLPSSTFY
ncbi:Hypothetical predicted protein [Paramuricea clavata]|uniref:Uncharacterized protein n=1 Tax=Paramuricea clavata TaxID=317549 RepID=A0A6S7G2Y2_PARCT|nr:Hypothetical predicted protein [Paramuricea clavata]